MSTADVHLRLLGRFQLSHGARELAVSPQAMRLLAFLAVQPTAVDRARVASVLWPDAAADHGAANLRSALWRLPRPAQRPLIRHAGGAIQLSADIDVDLHAVKDAACEVLNPQALCEDVLPDWDDDWLLALREWFRQLRLHALEDLCAWHRRAGRLDAALEAGLTAIRCEPLRESAHRAVVEVHRAEGNDAEALRQYGLYRRMIHEELGLAPSHRFRDLVAPLLGRPDDR